MIRLEAAPEFDGLKTTECIANMVPELGKYNLKRMLRNGDIRLNGSRIGKNFAVTGGDIIEVYTPIEFERVPLLDICYEDRNMIVLNKQPGSVVAGNAGKDVPDMLSAVINYMRDTGEYSEEGGIIPFPCFKLDIFTGGLVIYAKNGDMFEVLREALRQRRIKRVFQAIVKGCPEQRVGEFRHFYVKDGKDKYRVANRKIKDAVPIYTKYRVLKTNGDFSLVEIEPVTQYMNQERAHIEAAGYPILGDMVYGDGRLNKRMGIRYQALWATAVEFTTGINNVLEYMNGKQVYTDDINFPLVNM
jgi:23S rRNA-/tRNA-specific pseudouridylate synthase